MNLLSAFSNVFLKRDFLTPIFKNQASSNNNLQIQNPELPKQLHEINTILNRIENLYTVNNNTFMTFINKMKNKLDLIRTMQQISFPSYRQADIDNIIHHLNFLETELDKHLKSRMIKLNAILGTILHNIYQTSGYNIILSNIPQYAETNNPPNEELITVDSEAIYDTLLQFVRMDEILLVVQISYSRYLIKTANDDIAKKLCNLLHKKQISNNIINMEFIECQSSILTDISNSSTGITNNEQSNSKQSTSEQSTSCKPIIYKCNNCPRVPLWERIYDYVLDFRRRIIARYQ